MTARLIIGDTRDVLRTLPDQSVDLILTSPPFLALRSYLPSDHPDKAAEIGSEATPGEFLDVLLDVVEECARVLTAHGSLVFELGDTFSGSGGAGGDYGEDGLRGDAPGFDGSAARRRFDPDSPGQRAHHRGHDTEAMRRYAAGKRDKTPPGWPLAKSLCMIPQSFAWALAYGRNPWTGRTTEPWRVRNWITWARPSPPVGALRDKVRPASSWFTVACKSKSRWFDLDAVRTEGVEPGAVKHKVKNHSGANPSTGWTHDNELIHQNPNGAPPLDWWGDDYADDELATMTLVQPTQGYPGAHYATWPEAVAKRMIDMMCPTFVCRECGEPRRRIVDVDYVNSNGKRAPKSEWKSGVAEGKGAHSLKTEVRTTTTTTTTTGWTSCGHDDYRRGLVCDPFAGSGTTLAVAEGCGRDSIGIDLDARNVELAVGRCGMFLTTETP